MRPDYDKLRSETKFRWSVNSSYDSLLALTGIPIRDFYLDPSAGIEAYRKGRPLFREMFGDSVYPPPLSTPHVSYGHVNCLGADLKFPEGGEVCSGASFASLIEGINALRHPIDFSSSGMTEFYIDYKEKLTKAFDGETCNFAFGYEGPITSAYLLRGHDVFFDIQDNPEPFKEFLGLLTKSIIDFTYFHSDINVWPHISNDWGGLYDDVASMFKPEMWPEFVLPYWEEYFRGKTTGNKFVHVEDLRKEHLHFLEDIEISLYDPSISAKINPKIVTEACRVPFMWRLGSIYYHLMTYQDVEDFVYQAVADGASQISGDASGQQCNEDGVNKINAFIHAAKEVERMLNDGAAREDIGKCVSQSGRQKFWNHWPE